MEKVEEILVALPLSASETARVLAERKNCTVGELILEALCRYQEVDRLLDAVASGQGRSEAVDDWLEQYVVRVIHEDRADRAYAAAADAQELRAS